MLSELITASIAYPAGGFTVWWVMRFNQGPPGLEHVQQFMSRVVSDEALEENRKIRRLEMVRAGRKTTRADGGPNAKMLKVRVKRGSSMRRP